MYRKLMEKLRKRRNEKGIAVVFVLGILGLLTVIGLGFASTALLDNKIAKNNVNNEKARLLARSAYMRAYLLLRHGASAERIYTRSTPVTYDWLWRLNTTMDGQDIYALPSQFDPAVNTNLPAWQYVRNPAGTEILGRFAYVIQAEKGKMDPSVHFGKYLAANLPPTASRLKRFGTSESELLFRDAITDNAAIYNNVKEEFYGDLYNKTVDTGNALNNGANAGEEKKLFETPERWQDFTSMMSEVSASVTPLQEQNIRDTVETLHSGTPETFWIDKDNDKNQTTDEMFHRFNLGRTDWDKEYFDDVHILFGGSKKDDGSFERIKSTVNGLEEECRYNARPAGDKNLYRQDKDRADAANTGSADACFDTGGIQWLGGWVNNPASYPGNWTEDLKRKQIAANIIQYCRKDTSLTVTDLSADKKSDWVANNADPLYAGVGKHPLLNEAAVKASVHGAVVETPVTDSPSYYDWRYEVTLDFGTELIDMFNIAAKRKSEIYFIGRLIFDYYDLNEKLYKQFKMEIDRGNGKITVDPSVSPSPWGSNGYTTKASFWNNLPVTVFPVGRFQDDAGKDFKGDLKIKNVKLVFDKIYLKYADSSVPPAPGLEKMVDRDFAWINRTFGTEAETEVPVVDQKHFYGAVAAEDPRVNHYQNDWKTISDNGSGSVIREGTETVPAIAALDADAFAGASIKATPGENNQVLALNNDSADREPAGDPALGTISTAYIAERPMLSLWELGAISRGEKWRTINLKSAVPHPAFPAGEQFTCGGNNTSLNFNAGAGQGYEGGDGNILDQVKINRLFLGDDLETALNGGTAPVISNYLKNFWCERTSSFGKININSSLQNVLEALFKEMIYNSTDLTTVAAGSRNAYYSFVGRQDLPEEGSAFSGGAALAGQILRDPSGAPAKRQEFRTRADLLLNEFGLQDAFKSSGNCDAAQEQLIGKTVNLLKAETLDRAYIIAVAQTIKAVETPSGFTKYFDWNRDGNVGNDAVNVSNDRPVRNVFSADQLAWKRAGYVRYPLARELHGDSTYYQNIRLRGVGFGTVSLPTHFSGAKTKTVYVNGVDEITGTAKVVVTLERVDNQWKIVRYEYVD